MALTDTQLGRPPRPIAPEAAEASRDAGGRRSVVLVIWALGAGGAERIIINLANYWARRGWSVTLVSFERPGTRPYYPIDQRVDLQQLGTASGNPYFVNLARILALRRVVQARRPDVVISFLVKVNVLAALAVRGLNVPLVVSERNNPQMQRVHPIWSALRKATYRAASRVVAPSRGVLNSLTFVPHGRGRVIPNAVDAPQRPRRRRSANILAVGRLVPQKGFDLLLEAFAAIAPERPDWNLVIWGEGGERAALERRRDALGLTSRIRMPGVTATPGTWVEDGDVFVLSSRYESFGNVVAEAMAAGLAVVCFDCPWGPGEIVTHGVDGLLVPREDVGALAAALRQVTGDPALRERLGAAAQANIERFRPERILAEWDDLVEELVSGRQRAPVPA